MATAELQRGQMDLSSDIEAQLQYVPTYDIDALLDNADGYTISFVGEGFRSYVFRIRDSIIHPDMTIKLFFANNSRTFDEFSALCNAAEYNASGFGRLSFLWTIEPDEPFIEQHIEGHVQGNTIVPENIDTPICRWARRTDTGSSETVGYSLPYVDGEAIMISQDPQLVALSGFLYKEHGIYVGNKGDKYSDSKNAVVNHEKGIKKFIDVRIWTEEDLFRL